MSIYYIPYHGNKPAAVEINGHRLVILSKDKESLKEDMRLLGADKIKRLRGNIEADEDLPAIDRIAKKARAGIVFAQDEIKVEDIIRNLEEQLPWLH